MDSLQETAITLSNGTIADPYDLPFPQNEGPNPKCTTNTEEFQTDRQTDRIIITILHSV